MKGKSIYTLNSISFSYSRNQVFKDISLEIEKGSILAVLGPNGCGKSTFIRLLSKILRSDKGEISLYGRDIAEYSSRELARIIAYVPQNFYINFNYDVYSIVETGRYPHMMNIFSSLSDQDKRIINNAIDDWELNDLRRRSVLDLSGGERQLTIIASSIAQSSRILLFDEPTSNLDLKHIRLFVKNIKRLKDSYDIIIFVTHDINLASILADNILCFPENGGHIVDNKDKILNKDTLETVFNTNIREEKGLFYID